MNSTLSPYEKELLNSILKGFTVQQIAGDFSYSPGVIFHQVQGIYEKLGVANRQQALKLYNRDLILARDKIKCQ